MCSSDLDRLKCGFARGLMHVIQKFGGDSPNGAEFIPEEIFTFCTLLPWMLVLNMGIKYREKEMGIKGKETMTTLSLISWWLQVRKAQAVFSGRSMIP